MKKRVCHSYNDEINSKNINALLNSNFIIENKSARKIRIEQNLFHYKTSLNVLLNLIKSFQNEFFSKQKKNSEIKDIIKMISSLQNNLSLMLTEKQKQFDYLKTKIENNKKKMQDILFIDNQNKKVINKKINDISNAPLMSKKRELELAENGNDYLEYMEESGKRDNLDRVIKSLLSGEGFEEDELYACVAGIKRYFDTALAKLEKEEEEYEADLLKKREESESLDKLVTEAQLFAASTRAKEEMFSDRVEKCESRLNDLRLKLAHISLLSSSDRLLRSKISIVRSTSILIASFIETPFPYFPIFLPPS